MTDLLLLLFLSLLYFQIILLCFVKLNPVSRLLSVRIFTSITLKDYPHAKKENIDVRL